MLILIRKQIKSSQRFLMEVRLMWNLSSIRMELGCKSLVIAEPILFAQTVFVILDLVCKHDVLQMKKFNGYYGCGLCTMRGVQRYPGGRSHPNNQSFTMRDPGMHEYLVRQFDSGSVEERKARKEKDPEIDTLGVKGRSYLFKVIPNLPLTCPVDTMHQCLKGVANDIINFFAEQLSYDEVQKIDDATKQVTLPSKFKRSVRSLRSLEHFKANELKTFFSVFCPNSVPKFSRKLFGA